MAAIRQVEDSEDLSPAAALSGAIIGGGDDAPHLGYDSRAVTVLEEAMALGALFAPMFETVDPFVLFDAWFAEAKAAELNDPDAMGLATVDADGLPDLRVVLLKAHGPDGFVFYTNGESAKGRELAATPKAALNLHWKSLRRQVRVRGPVSAVSAGESDAYFAGRSRDSRLAAIASDQSRPMDSREAFEARVAAAATRFGEAEPERPAHWGGYRVTPVAIEFWRDGAHRMHDRRLFTRTATDADWRTTRLYP